MSSFLQTASNRVGDVRTFLRNATQTSLKYSAANGETHYLYFPTREQTIIDPETKQETKVNTLVAIYGNIHEWNDSEGHFHSCACLQGVTRKGSEGETLNDGTCPFCNRTKDAYDIVNYRMAQEEETCQLTGDQRKAHLENAKANFNRASKAKRPRPYMYVLVAKLRTEGQKPVLDQNGVPEYDLRIMRMSKNKAEKITNTLETLGMSLENSELIFQYPKTDDPRLLGSQCTVMPKMSNKFSDMKGFKEKLEADVENFSFDGIDRQGFPEWAGMSTEQAKAITDEAFARWDAYVKEKAVNPAARYLEYVSDVAANNPALSVGAAPATPAAALPGAAVPGAAVPGAAPAAPAIPSLGDMPSPDAIFGGAGTIQI